MSQYETGFPNFYFLSANDGCFYNSLSEGHSVSRAFTNQPVNLGHHSAKRLADYFKSKRYLTSVKNRQCCNEF